MSNKNNQVVKISAREAQLKRKIRRHLNGIGLRKGADGNLHASGNGKEVVRALHGPQRADRQKENKEFIQHNIDRLNKYFASGNEVDPERIRPTIERVRAKSWQGDLFRLASLTWSVPVSQGFGRRLRYLVWDASNGKLIGIFAIGDPVFNLGVRDRYIGWDSRDRSNRLANLMDAYVVGAVPPYNLLLGGKLVACLISSRDVYDDFRKVYGSSTGIISEQRKQARLLAITTSSSMGRSSVYNRLKINGTRYLTSIGYTGGWGHFHIPDGLFQELREYLRLIGHHYADHHAYGQGPNWRLRTLRTAFVELGIGDDILRHGVNREVFISFLARNGASILRTGKGRPDLSSLSTVQEIGEQAVNRWMVPRASRRPEFRDWPSKGIRDLVAHPQRVDLAWTREGDSNTPRTLSDEEG
ncbi:Druantia anti-phage system protein DruA [Halofilum ochraceum]|uniref:Druantia anti-phage system protein DruA n=1 Tax=Halofilum ochraceum TaxID=1611323 RepID=UPI000946CACF|nr:Druantia anti-phage system protein DruA [Halofilum ochraceum]